MSSADPAVFPGSSPSPSPVDPHGEAIAQLLDGETTWDKRLIRWSDWFNPILVKETRQALKSKQFSWTFGLLVVVVLGWSILGIIGSIPNIYYASDGRNLLAGYLLILVVPAWIIIPQATFRSMASELDDGTFETLSLSMLKPSHIILGKLNVAMLQLMIYMSVVAPCIALTYLLRGVTLGLILFLFAASVMVTLSLAMVAVSLASFSRNRALQVIFSVVLIAIQLIVTFWLSAVLISLIIEGIGDVSSSLIMWKILGYWGGFTFLYSWVLFSCATGLIGVSSENKSTPIRISLLATGIAIAVAGIIVTTENESDRISILALFATLAMFHWTFAGSFIVGEKGFISARAKRSLPNSLVGKVLFSWFIPGAGTGFVFVLMSLGGTLLVYALYQLVALELDYAKKTTGLVHLSALWLYAALYLGVGRMASWLLFRKMGVGRIVATGLFLVVFNVLGVIASCLFSLWDSNYQNMDFGFYCFINPWWTLAEAFPTEYGQNTNWDVDLAVFLLAVVAIPIFLINLFLTAKDIVVQRVEIPERVQQERARISGKAAPSPAEEEIIDPLA